MSSNPHPTVHFFEILTSWAIEGSYLTIYLILIEYFISYPKFYILGITLGSLWVRLLTRDDFKMDDFLKPFLWKCACHQSKFEFYELPQSRPTLQYVSEISDQDDEVSRTSVSDEFVILLADWSTGLSAHLDIFINIHMTNSRQHIWRDGLNFKRDWFQNDVGFLKIFLLSISYFL